MYTVKCDQCQRKFTKPNKTRAKLALRMHVGRAHSKHIVNKAGSSIVHAVVPDDPTQGVPLGTRRRSFESKRRANGTSDKAVAKAAALKDMETRLEVAAAAEDFRYCPHCAFNLNVALRAVVVARRHGVKHE